jgi:putative ABC transport system permease protein
LSICSNLRLFHWAVLRYIAQHRTLAALNVLSVALGVAVFLATQFANQSANRAFAATVDLVAGKADLQISAAGRGVPDTILPAVTNAPGVAAATPLVRGFVTLPDLPGEYLEILGVDVFTNEPFRTFDIAHLDTQQGEIEQWLGQRETIAISEQFATNHGLRRGDGVRAQVNGADHLLRIGFILKASGDVVADPHFAAMDIGWAQELFGRRGELTSIQLRIGRGADRDDVIQRLRAIVPPDATVAPPVQRSQQVEKMLSGFELNLTAMSLVSLLVGMFLIYNSVSASVVRRRHEIGILRSLGVTRGELRALFLGEAVFFGIVGSVLGAVGGLLLARGLVQVVAGTISSLYVLVNVTAVRTSPWTFLAGGCIGLGSVLVAAWLPARAAAGIEPVRALQGPAAVQQVTPLSRRWFCSGLGMLASAALFSFLALAVGPPWLGFVAAFCVLAGFSFLVPAVAARFSSATATVLRVSRRQRAHLAIEAELAAANIPRALMRNSVTAASLAAAIAMTVGVSVMVFSFRQTVGSWINQTLLADLFIAPASNELVGPSSFIPPAAIRFLEQQRGVGAVDTFREIDLPFRGDTVAVAVIRGTERRRLQFVHGDSRSIMRRFYSEQCVLVSESFARRQHVLTGETLELPTPTGVQQFPIAGIFYDYTRDQGVVYMSRQNFLRFWNDDRVNTVAVYLNNAASGDELTAAFRQKFSPAGQFVIYSNRTLRARAFEIFDQTFAVTYVLRTIAVIVALVGIFVSLTTLIVERARELAIMRAIGGSAQQVRRLLLWEAGFIGLLAAIVGLASGVCLSAVLTGVINRAFFGWTIRLAFPWLSLALTPTWIVAAAVVAGIVPAWRAGKMALADALRAE